MPYTETSHVHHHEQYEVKHALDSAALQGVLARLYGNDSARAATAMLKATGRALDFINVGDVTLAVRVFRESDTYFIVDFQYVRPVLLDVTPFDDYKKHVFGVNSAGCINGYIAGGVYTKPRTGTPEVTA